jgi:hypothetical protein
MNALRVTQGFTSLTVLVSLRVLTPQLLLTLLKFKSVKSAIHPVIHVKAQ